MYNIHCSCYCERVSESQAYHCVLTFFLNPLRCACVIAGEEVIKWRTRLATEE